MKDNLENIQDSQTKPNKRKKRVKQIFLWLWLFIWFCLLRILCRIPIYFLYCPISGPIGLIFSILVPLFVEILIAYLIILWRTRKFWWKDKLKKFLKYSLIIHSPFLLLSAFAFFTKAWIIYNWLEIEQLCPWIGNSCYDKNKYENYENEAECWRILKIKWYSKINYDRWSKRKSKEEIGFFYSHGNSIHPFPLYGIKNLNTLTDMSYYEERLDDKFEKYKNQIIECEDKRYKNYEKYFAEKMDLGDRNHRN